MATDGPAPGFRRWALEIEYDGTGLCGWQRQENGLSVQELLETAAMRLVSGVPVASATAGRTDAGVHAAAMVVQLDLPEAAELGAHHVRDGLSFHLKPHLVAIRRAALAPPGWHARFSALWRSYRYTILNRPTRPVLDHDHVWHVKRPLDVEAMRAGAALLIGRHDFSSFRAASCQASGPVRTLDLLDVRRDGEYVTIDAKARSFLHHQVRNLAGSLQLVGSGQWTPGHLGTVLAARDRRLAGPTAPPEGLCLTGVGYPEDPFAP
ncbi:tRNA pseudouridine(38-40) synthase TruA [Acidomonas methanolica]|uniref:tRNA pseudouridine(38-40) synthase TruA n=1 Tax=Acidomonas methanolica TaxID=437 RepID=UPI00211A3D79|nr:tRNA pseudouridine(38-40) synthase TruA [Acidomonas methanolica]MCQ9155341.1 tRNA pseudouridine(38-40) synthase TruA [Acidomonas methanolica]